MKRLFHKGRGIVFHNYISLPPEQLVAAIIKNVDEATTEGKRDLRILIDVEGSSVTQAILTTFKEQGKLLKPYIGKLAVVGLEPIHHFFLHIVNKATDAGGRPFKDREEAKDWLVE